jgi:transglutaminase-like putative cysteine protease
MTTYRFEPAHDRARLGMLLAAVGLVMLPHVAHLEGMVLAYVGLLLIWRTAALLGTADGPGKLVLWALTLAGAVLVYSVYDRLYGREAGAALFAIGLTLKLMELKSARDAYLVVFLAFFVAITQFLFSQTIAMAAYTLAVAVVLVATLVGFNSPDHFGIGKRLKLAATMVAQALPLMVVLFVFFPRITGPLWQIPDDGRQARTGLGDTIEPGAISRLGLSQQPAFRVDFEGEPPPPAQRYWRGPVFWQTDGRRWTLPADTFEPSTQMDWRGPIHRYTVTLEPHSQRWVLALDLPSAYPSELSLTSEYVLLTKHKVTERARFRLESRTRYNTGELSPRERALGLSLPAPPSARMRALVDSWQAQSPEPAALVQRALGHFREQAFHYTLNPPLLGDDPVDEFLFESRRGFCEHYATAFAVLMRAAGIPARVVTGYQGGQWNAVGRFLEVKQADAHAWAEVWLPGQGWTRIDPTAAVAPERIEHGLDIDTQIAAGEIRFNLPAGLAGKGLSGLAALQRQARLLWASVDHAWDLWVLSYDPARQARLWEKLGIVDWVGLAGWLAGGAALAGGLVALWILPKRPARLDKAMRVYRRFCAKLARRGLVKRPTEGALDFSRRAAAALPDAQVEIGRVTALYLGIRYGRHARPGDLRRLSQLVRKLRL